MSFWDHLDELRKCIFRGVAVLLVAFVVLFFFKEFIFDGIILAPTTPDFWLYKLLGMTFSLKLINIEVTAQFFIHMRVTFIVALIVTFPYLIYCLWSFIAPALYSKERRTMKTAFGLGAGLFYLGVATGYFIVMPLVMYFFSGYQVSDAVENNFSLSSYISIFTGMVLMMGILYEFPSVIAILSRLGLVGREFFKKHRKHALVIILIVAAILTPTGDPFTMCVVAGPLYLLYEFSIILCKPKEEGSEESDDAEDAESQV